MKKSLFLSVFILCFMFQRTDAAQSVIYCAHPELCKMLERTARAHGMTLKTEAMVNISGDPHEYEPSAKEIKGLISAPFLLTGPHELNPWIKKISDQRAKMPGLDTIALTFSPEDLQLYKEASPEALSHFWIYPRVYCSLQKKLENELIKRKLISKENMGCDYSSAEEQLRSALRTVKIPLILTHDALLGLLKFLSTSTDLQVLAIKGSGHHEEVSTVAIKKLYLALKSPSVIWIKEKGINVPPNIQDKIRSGDKVIIIDSAKTEAAGPFSVLTDLTQKLNELKKQ